MPSLRAYKAEARPRAIDNGHSPGSRGAGGAPSEIAQEPASFLQLRSDGAWRRGTGGPFGGDAAFGGEELSGDLRERRVRRRELLTPDLLQRYPELLASPD